MHPACPNKKQNHLQNSLLRRTQFWVRKTFSKPASLKRASLVALPVAISHKVSLKPKRCASATLIQKTSKNEPKHGPKNGTAWRSHFWDRMHSLVKEQKKSTFTVPFLGPSGGTKNETAKSQNPQQRPTRATNKKLQLRLFKQPAYRNSCPSGRHKPQSFIGVVFRGPSAASLCRCRLKHVAWFLGSYKKTLIWICCVYIYTCVYTVFIKCPKHPKK